ncbi:MAG TPA: DNA polymerase IV [Syntrophales bacterium]|nr:DNA polymerase IV [Syntrophales bacterium]HPQ44468.1 DNA polymerase IV [Syntrophales bacterium]
MILHVDMDAFFASVEELDNPLLKGRCVIVGGQSERGVVSAANYEARKFGVHSAMPIFQARDKCPEAIILPPRMGRYKELSGQIMSVLREFSPLVEPVSIDEAFVDITGCERLFGGVEAISVGIKRQIRQRLNLTCSLGAAPNKFLAKIASDMDKPDGLTIIMPEQVRQFIDSLPIHKVPGVGKSTHDRLIPLGIRNLGDVKRYPPDLLTRKFGAFGSRLIELSDGIDRSVVTPVSETKSVSAEETLFSDTDDKQVLKRYIMKQAERVARELRKQDIRARTVSIKIKHSDFKQITRSVTIEYPTQSSEIIIREAFRLLENYRMPKKARLIGVGVSNLVSRVSPEQVEIFERDDPQNSSWEKLDNAVDTITEKFGRDFITRASLKDKK